MSLIRTVTLSLLFALASACAGGNGNETEAEPPIAESENTIAPTDLGALALGEPVEIADRPEIDSSLIAGDVALGNLLSRVRCPDGVERCLPADLPRTTIYTYVYEVRPGFDDPNNPGLAMPEQVVPVERGESFALAFPASGFTGVAGYAVEPARDVLAEGFNAVIACEDGRLTWTVPADAEWSTGDTLTFFWQSTQPPSDSLGEYIFIGDGAEGRGRGPMPVAGGAALPAVCQ